MIRMFNEIQLGVQALGNQQGTDGALMNKLQVFIRQDVIHFGCKFQRIMDPFELDKEFQMYVQLLPNGYYHEYCRLLLANIALTTQMKEFIEEKNQLISRLRKYEDEEFISQSDRQNDKGKRMRRNADEIQRYYKCSVKACSKSYGSEGSLNQHYKLKHPQIYVTLPNVQCGLLPQSSKEEPEEAYRDKENSHRYSNLKRYK